MHNNKLINITSEEFEVMYSPDFSKRDAVRAGEQLVNKMLEDGLVNEYKVWSNIARLKEVINSADKTLRDKLTPEGVYNVNGVEFSLVNGRKSLNYEEDEVYTELKAKIKAREELLKAAQSSEIYDEGGIQVPKVSISLSKESINVKF